MDDIAPELAKQIADHIAEAEAADGALAAIYELIASGSATYAQAYDLAGLIGGHMSAALQAVLTTDALPDGKLYYNIADRTVRPALEAGYSRITEAAADIQTQLNAAAGFGMKGLAPEAPAERIHGIVQRLSDAENIDDVAWLLDEPVKTLSRSAVDETIRENVELHARAGLSPRIVRVAGNGCCEWCTSLAGTYEYPAPQDVYRRHERCRCVVEYDPRNGSRRQNVWTKQWTDPEADAKIEARKVVNSKGPADPKTHPIHPITGTRYEDHDLVFDDKQFGKKVGKHAADYGLDPTSEQDREALRAIIQRIVSDADERVYLQWRYQKYPVLAHIRSSDVVLEGTRGEFITILKGGATNARIKNARE